MNSQRCILLEKLLANKTVVVLGFILCFMLGHLLKNELKIILLFKEIYIHVNLN